MSAVRILAVGCPRTGLDLHRAVGLPRQGEPTFSLGNTWTRCPKCRKMRLERRGGQAERGPLFSPRFPPALPELRPCSPPSHLSETAGGPRTPAGRPAVAAGAHAVLGLTRPFRCSSFRRQATEGFQTRHGHTCHRHKARETVREQYSTLLYFLNTGKKDTGVCRRSLPLPIL